MSIHYHEWGIEKTTGPLKRTDRLLYVYYISYIPTYGAGLTGRPFL